MALLPPPGRVPIFATYCIDSRYDALASEFLRAVGFETSYFLGTNAGAALSLGYDKSCRKIRCQRCTTSHNDENTAAAKQKHKKCCGGSKDMKKLEAGFATNLQIAFTLQPITTVYLLDHQDCAAIRAFLPCSGYPAKGEVQKDREISINAQILTFASRAVRRRFRPIEQVLLGLLDVNGTVGNYRVESKTWTIVYVGEGQDPTGLWFGHTLGETVFVPDCDQDEMDEPSKHGAEHLLERFCSCA